VVTDDDALTKKTQWYIDGVKGLYDGYY